MPLSLHDRDNFETLSEAFRNGDVLLMECQDVATSKSVPVICSVNPHADGSRTLLVPVKRVRTCFPDDWSGRESARGGAARDAFSTELRAGSPSPDERSA